MKDALDGILPTVKQFSLRSGADIHVMGFVGYQDDAVLTEVFEGDGILSLVRQMGVEFLDGGETDVDVFVVKHPQSWQPALRRFDFRQYGWGR